MSYIEYVIQNKRVESHVEQATNDIISINNTQYNVSMIVCKANLQYIARLACHKNKSLCIVDGRKYTYVFGYSWLPLFTVGPHTKKSNIIGFDEMAARKKNLPIGPHATKVKDSIKNYNIKRLTWS